MTRQPQYDAAALSARAEIVDVIHLVCHVLDRHRWELMPDAFHSDAAVKYSFRPQVQTYREWVAVAQVTMSAFPSTLHNIGTILIDIVGDTAWAESYVTAIHRVPPSAPKDSFWDGRDAPYDGTAAGRYIDKLERRAGKWKIAERRALIEWRHDAPVRDGTLSQLPIEGRGQWGDADHSRPVVARRLAALE